MFALTFPGNPVVPEGHSYLNSTFCFSIKSTKAQFFLPQPSDPKRLIDLIGPGRAKLMLVAGQKLDSCKAYEFGLVDEIVKVENLISRAHTLLDASLSARSDHISDIKRLMN